MCHLGIQTPALDEHSYSNRTNRNTFKMYVLSLNKYTGYHLMFNTEMIFYTAFTVNKYVYILQHFEMSQE